MAKGFQKGGTYIIYSEAMGHWYLVKQTGMKTWIATNFTNVDIDKIKHQFQNNGVKLWNMLKPRDDYKVVTSNQKLRGYMFDILQYGYFKD